MSPQDREGRLGPALLVALLVLALITGVLVYHARTPNLALEVFIDERIVPRAELPVELEFFVRFDEPDALVEIVGRGDETARTFAADAELAEEERVRCVWDGLDDAGEPVAPGNYRLRVVLPSRDRDMVFPQRIAIRSRGGIEERVDVLGQGPCERASGETLE